MSQGIPFSARDREDLHALRRAIAQLAGRCSLNLDDRRALRLVLDGHLAGGAELALLDELRTMLVLLHRLESSSSEDLGYSGLQRLWRQHDEILAGLPAADLRPAAYP